MLDKILIIHGPNLNLLGHREPDIYGNTSFSELCMNLEKQGKMAAMQVENFQSNSEGVLIDRLHQCVMNPTLPNLKQPHVIIINPAGFSHTSIALLDAILATQLAFIEVHLSNIHNRESFRHHSYFSEKAKAVVCGMGIHGYFYALDYAKHYLKNRSSL